MSDFFKQDGAATEGALDLNALMPVRSNQASSSEQVEAMLEAYTKLKEKNPSGYLYSMLQLSPQWIGDKELVILFLEAGGKLAITPIIFGASEIEATVRDSNDTMIRAANYSVTKNIMYKKGEAPHNVADIPTSNFLKLCSNELIKGGHINELPSYGPENLQLAGCIIVDGTKKVDTYSIIAVAVSEMRAALWDLHGTNSWVASEPDMNYLNHSDVTTSVDLTTSPTARDILGNNLFSPVIIRMSHYRTDELSGGNTRQLTPKVEINGYLDFRPLTSEELSKYAAANANAPLLIPQFVVVGLNNRANEGVTTPPVLLDAIAGISKFKGPEMVKMMEQCAQYQSTVDTACSTYDWNQLSVLISLAAAERGASVGTFEPMNPITYLTGEENPSPIQVANAYEMAFGPMELLVDCPQSGEMACVRQRLFNNLNYYHRKLTGKPNRINNALGGNGLVPQGPYVRVSDKAQEERDVREQFNSLNMVSKFHQGTTATDNFILGTQYANGRRVREGDNNDRDFLDNYNFVNEVLIDDGSFKLKEERQRVLVSLEYREALVADLESNNVRFEIKHSGRELIRRLSATNASTSSLNLNNLY